MNMNKINKYRWDAVIIIGKDSCLVTGQSARKLFEHLDTFSLSYKQKNKFLSKEGPMKRIIMLAMILLIMLVSIGGCRVVREDDRNGEYDRDRCYKTFDGHDTRNTIMKNI